MPRDRFEKMAKLPSPIKNLFFPPQIGRLEYVARNLAYTVLVFVPLGMVGERSAQSGNLAFITSYLLLTLVAFVFGFPVIILPRMRDLQWPAFLAVLAIIPGANLVFGLALAFTPGK